MWPPHYSPLLLLGCCTAALALGPLNCANGSNSAVLTFACSPFQSHTDVIVPQCAVGCSLCSGQPWVSVFQGNPAVWTTTVGTSVPIGGLLVGAAGILTSTFALGDSGGSPVPGDQVDIAINTFLAGSFSLTAPGLGTGCGACSSVTNLTSLSILSNTPTGTPMPLTVNVSTNSRLAILQLVALSALVCTIPETPSVTSASPAGTGFLVIGSGILAAKGTNMLRCRFGDVVVPGSWVNYTSAFCPSPSSLVGFKESGVIPQAFPALLSVGIPPVWADCAIPVCLVSPAADSAAASSCATLHGVIAAGLWLCHLCTKVYVPVSRTIPDVPFTITVFGIVSNTLRLVLLAQGVLLPNSDITCTLFDSESAAQCTPTASFNRSSLFELEIGSASGFGVAFSDCWAPHPIPGAPSVSVTFVTILTAKVFSSAGNDIVHLSGAGLVDGDEVILLPLQTVSTAVSNIVAEENNTLAAIHSARELCTNVSSSISGPVVNVSTQGAAAFFSIGNTTIVEPMVVCYRFQGAASWELFSDVVVQPAQPAPAQTAKTLGLVGAGLFTLVMIAFVYSIRGRLRTLCCCSGERYSATVTPREEEL